MATSTQQLSSSCQRIFSDENVFSNTLANSQRTTTGTHYIKGTGSLGRLKYQQKHKSLDASDEELEYTQLSQSTHILGRFKSERLLAFNSDGGDRRRRTIIVEKRNNSYGFTLQSYAIHYRHDPEFETITYVDYVEYDGPAYRAGMREGDVILSINGVDLEKADHKTLVAFIKSCDTRMRMVVLFEDCVRKVELHMRYIQLQTLLQNKLNELECIALRERELLDGKWKTHSLPVRKKATTSPTDNDISPLDGADYAYYRPALSTENVPNITRYYATPTTIIPPPAQFRLTRHYRNSSAHNSAEFSNASDQQQYVFKRVDSNEQMKELTRRISQSKPAQEEPVKEVENVESTKQPPPQQQQQRTRGRIKSSSKHCHSHSCNPCIGHFRWKSAQKAAANGNLTTANNDNVSLDAYDLASPCCDTHCVPNRRRLQHKHMKQREHGCEGRSKERVTRPKSQPIVETGTQSQQLPIQTQQHGQRHHHHHHHHHHHQQQQQHQKREQKQQVGTEQPQPQVKQHQQLHACGSTGSAGTAASSVHSQYIDLSTGLISYCTLHQASRGTGETITTTTTDNIWEPMKPEQQQQQQQTIFVRQQSSKSSSSYQLTHEQQQQQNTPPRPPPRPTHPTLYGGMYQQRYHITATQIQPSQICINPLSTGGTNTATFVQKPRSWDNLTTKAIAMGYGYLDTNTGGLQPTIKLQIQQPQQQQQQRHSMPRKNPHGRFSTYGATNVENYAPPPSQFVGEFTTTTTTTILAKSTEHLLTPTNQPPGTVNINHNNINIANCGCTNPPPPPPSANVNSLKDQTQLNAFKTAQMEINQNKKFSHYNNCQLGYYSHLPRPTADVATSTTSVVSAPNAGEQTGDITTVSEVTRL